MFGRTKRKREYHEALEKAWDALARQRMEVERLLGPVARTIVGTHSGSFESEAMPEHDVRHDDD